MGNKQSRLKYVSYKDIFSCFIFLFMAPIALVAKIFIHDFWLVGEEKNEARDNGYWFFKYVRENHHNQKIAYVINKKSNDYHKVKNLGKVIQWGSLSHWFWYLVAKKNISSQKGCKPNAAACYLFEIKLRLWRNKRYFLQHGVIMNNLEWLYYDKCFFKLFCCSAIPEYKYVVDKFGYNGKRIVECVGLTRFDSLVKESEQKRQVLVMPTWRAYLVRSRHGKSFEILKNEFSESQYFKCWSELLKSERLKKILSTYNYTLLFYPHRNMQVFLDFFKTYSSESVKIVDPNDISVQDALKQSQCMITDYSSVFFDFAYLKKPIIFYQFDEKDFRKMQYGEGYFDFHKNSLGEWCGDLNACLDLLEVQLKNDCQNLHTNDEDFFAFYDTNNCERTYKAILTH